MQPPPSRMLFRFLNALIGPTLFGLSAGAAAGGDEGQTIALQGDSYLCRELVAAVQAREQPSENRVKELRGLEPIGTPDSLFLAEEHSDGEYLAALTEVQVRHRTFFTGTDAAF